MSSITLKLSSLVIRTLSKPIANQIKAQAREHERFRRICVSFAQSLHRVDMRLRLGLLRDSAAIEKQAAREAAEAQARKRKAEIPTVKTEAQTKADEAKAARKKEESLEPPKPAPKPRIRPLSEAKAIDNGATFISEAFLFMVAGGLIVFESLRSRRKETSRREDVAARLDELEESEKAARRGMVALEKEILHLRAKLDKSTSHSKRILPKEVWDVNDDIEEEPEQAGWFSKISGYFSWSQGEENKESNTTSAGATSTPKPAEYKDQPNRPATTPSQTSTSSPPTSIPSSTAATS